jgi:septum formation protein
MSLVLASTSPRRRFLLERAGVPLARVVGPEVEELRAETEGPVDYAARLAFEKAHAVDAPGHWVLGADTVVHLGDRVLEKPRDRDDAAQMLRALRGRWHLVTTAWCLRWGGPDALPEGQSPIARRQTTRVAFRPLSEQDLRAYLDTGESMGKAGAYAIQGDGAALVGAVDGSFTNVIGLPLDQLLPVLVGLGLAPEPL